MTAIADSGTTNHASPADDHGPPAHPPPNRSTPPAFKPSAVKATATPINEAAVHVAYARESEAALARDLVHVVARAAERPRQERAVEHGEDARAARARVGHDDRDAAEGIERPGGIYTYI